MRVTVAQRGALKIREPAFDGTLDKIGEAVAVLQRGL